ncbi:hypothetical protein BGZ65_008675, partial [Modicella reniformis]
WPTIEREAKDQIVEKKVRCVFLPAVERAVPQLKEQQQEDSDYIEDNTLEWSQPTESVTPGSPSSPLAVRNIPDFDSLASTNDVFVLKRELETAQGTIQHLQDTLEKLRSEAYMIRQRKPEQSSSSAYTYSAVQSDDSIEPTYPLSYVAGAAAVAFIFAYIFF